MNQQFMRILLTKAGHAVDEVENGHLAVDAVRRCDYDVVLMDVQMPELDGVQATQQIRALGAPKSDVPIIALTAHAMQGAKDEYLAAGMDDYISKPVAPETLLSKLADIALTTRASGVEVAAPPLAEPEVAALLTDEPPTDPLDLARLKMFEDFLPPEEVRNLLDMYVANSGERMKSIRALVEAGDLSALAKEAHQLIGTSGNVGAARVSEVAATLEAACKAGDRAAVPNHVSALDGAVTAAVDAILAWLAGHSRGIVPSESTRVV